jgi:two-component system, NtrC family, sensor kinase
VQGLLDYARPERRIAGRQSAGSGQAELNGAVGTAVEFLQRQGLLGAANVALRLDAELPCVQGDRHALEQVVINLLMNGAQASPGGALRVQTARRSFEPDYRAEARRSDGGQQETSAARRWTSRPRRRDLVPGTPGALLCVADDGPGVAIEDRERIFDPFFTTKSPGEGTGLGLAIVARTVYDAGGVVWVDRAREGGAVFKVFLPLAGASDARTDR